MAHILISDDSIAMRQMLHFTLSGENHDVTEAGDGMQALRLAQAHVFDLVITDINMPAMDGLSLLNELRSLPAYQYKPILLLTTETDPEQKAKARSYGATGWINKPFHPEKLLAAIKKVLG